MKPRLPEYSRFLSRIASGRDRGGPRRRRPKADAIPLTFGYPYPESFAIDELIRAASTSLTEEGRLTMQYGGGPSTQDLRQYLFSRAVDRGVSPEGNDIMLSAGSMQALDIAGRTLIDPGDMVMIEAPSYFGAIRIFRSWGARIVGFPMDNSGLITGAVEDQLKRWRGDGRPIPKLFYAISNFHNPAGVTMSAERRRELLRLASEYDFLVLEDDAYGELRFEGSPVPSLKTLDDGMRVVQTGTFSKIIAPGMRLGWAIGPEALVGEMSRANSGGGLSTFVTGVLHAFCRDGDLDRRIDTLREAYRRRRDAMVFALETHMPDGVTWNNPEGGFFLWLEAPAEVDMEMLAPEAEDMGVTYMPGTAFFTDGRGKNYARLCFSFCDQEHLRRGVEILASLIKAALM